EDVATDHDGGHGGEVLLVEIGDGNMPALLAGARVEGDEIVVGRLHEEPVAVHAEAAVADVGAAPGLPEVMPEDVAVAGVDRPGVIGSGEIERAVDLENGGADVGVAASAAGVARALAADDGRGAAAAEAAAPAASAKAAGV